MLKENSPQQNIYPPNYYPDESTPAPPQNQNGFQLDKILSLLKSGGSAPDMFSLLGNNPQLSQIMSLMNGLQNSNAPKKQKNTIKVDCDYVLVKDYYEKPN